MQEQYSLITMPEGGLIPSHARLISPALKHDVLSAARMMWQLPVQHNSKGMYLPQNNPVSLERADLEKIAHQEYACTYKSDGVNYYLLLTRARVPGTQSMRPLAVMINRAEQLYEVQVLCDEAFFDGTLIIGELVTLNHASSTPQLVFQIYDAVCLAGDGQVRHMDFQTRLALLYDVVAQTGLDMIPRLRETEGAEHGTAKAHDTCFPLAATDESVRLFASMGKIVVLTLPLIVKEFFLKQEAEMIERYRQVRLPVETDGLIFVPIHSPIQVGRQYDLFKWKTCHTIDVLLEIWTDRYELSFWDNHQPRVGGHTSLDPLLLLLPPLESSSGTNDEEPVYLRLEEDGHGNEIFRLLRQQHEQQGRKKKLSVIVECACRLERDAKTVWCFILRTRSDKSTPNDRLTVQKTLLNIMENIQPEDFRF